MQNALRISLAAGLALLSGACDTCKNDESPTNTLLFRLVSLANQNLIGQGPTQYSPDSIRVLLNGQPFDFEVTTQPLFGDAPVVGLSARHLFASPPEARLLLRLSRTDTDTIDLRYAVREGRCFRSLEYQAVRYNGRLAAPDPVSGYYHFVKR
ncbi:hypothetical protein [Hymenobacter sp. CRA2]|uniref:hypothetical protein n=1 Tax=Hymenobacter sp. CRA2 TaxID=1955620 RepID=UPI00098EB4F2|nr:hypothetical protein [Hymenobacter sp. CRA2]OON70069.1 hypothetical protein B0919_04820 [Hymenobacter sp. CRA2]